MPKIMQFYAYEKEFDSQEVNRASANAVALIWSYFLEGANQRQALTEAGILLDEVHDFLNDQQRCRSAAVAVVSVMVGVVAIDVGSGRLDFLSALSKHKSEENKITSFRAATLTIRNS